MQAGKRLKIVHADSRNGAPGRTASSASLIEASVPTGVNHRGLRRDPRRGQNLGAGDGIGVTPQVATRCSVRYSVDENRCGTV